jgi:hypothetical protein
LPSVKEVIESVRAVGLVVQQNPARGGHTLWDIVDPKSGTILTGISGSAGKQGGDPNWYFNIRRVLRHAGFNIEFSGIRGKKSPKGKSGKRKPAVDLEALAKAQEQARAAGVHVPTLEDLDEHPELFRRSQIGGTSKPFNENATDEVINSMAPRVETPRFNATVQRLRALLESKEDELVHRAKERFAAEGKKWTSPSPSGSARSEFVRIAIEEVAPARELRAWPTLASGQQALYTILEKNKSASLWAVNLIEATMDHVDGLKWNVIDESKKRVRDAAAEIVQAVKDAGILDAEQAVKDAGIEFPDDGADQTTYDVAIALVDEYERSFQLIAAEARTVYTDEAWQQIADKPERALSAVKQLRTDFQEFQRGFPTATPEPVMDGSIREGYATALLDILANYTEEKGNYLLDQILARLDKLAGI